MPTAPPTFYQRFVKPRMAGMLAYHPPAPRGSASSRGYDAAWRRFRKTFLAGHPLCEDCEAAGRVTPATEPHHIKRLKDRPDLRCVESNCRALCKGCHSSRTGKGE